MFNYIAVYLSGAIMLKSRVFAAQEGNSHVIPTFY